MSLVSCSLNQKLTLAHQQMTADYEKMRQEEADISAKLQERMSVAKSGRSSQKRRVVAQSQDFLGGGGDGGRGLNGETHSIGSLEEKMGGGGGVGVLDKSWLICDKGIVSEADKRRLFGVIMNAKRRKEMLNLSEKHMREIEEGGNAWCGKEEKNLRNSRRIRRGVTQEVVDVVAKKRNFRGLVRDVLEQLPFALPTLQLHIILSLTMVLLTHQCPVASYFIAV